jgi:hypothetical protein
VTRYRKQFRPRDALVAIVLAKVLPAQEGHLMSQGDEFEFHGRRRRTRNESREPRADRRVNMPVTV